MDDLEAKEIEKTAKKAFIAEIKLTEIIKGAVNCQPRPLTSATSHKREYD